LNSSKLDTSFKKNPQDITVYETGRENNLSWYWRQCTLRFNV